MRFVAIPSFGLDALTIGEKEEPRPGPREVLIRVHANSLNYRDLNVVKGIYDPRMPLPRIPLSDGAGEVAEVGPGVTRVKTGDRVAGIFMQTWLHGTIREAYLASALGGAIDGMLAEYVVLHEDGVVHVPAHLSYEEAATLPCAAVTAWNALFCQGHLQPGDTVLIQGTGGVSVAALAFAKMAGATVIATSSSEDKLEKLSSLGVSEGINYKTTAQWGKRVKDITGAQGADHVVEVGGAGTLNQSLQAVRVGGHIHMIGVLTGVKAEVTTALMLHKSVQLHGIYVGSREMFEAMNRAIAEAKMKPVVDRVFGFTEMREALEYMQSGAHFGKIVIRHN